MELTNKNKASLLIALLLTFVTIIAFLIIGKSKRQEIANSSNSIFERYPDAKQCGGFVGAVCPEGYECVQEKGWPESAGGICLKK